MGEFIWDQKYETDRLMLQGSHGTCFITMVARHIVSTLSPLYNCSPSNHLQCSQLSVLKTRDRECIPIPTGDRRCSLLKPNLPLSKAYLPQAAGSQSSSSVQYEASPLLVAGCPYTRPHLYIEVMPPCMIH